MFSPLARYGAGTKAKKVAVIGVGGLGHMAILFAAAMGAEVTAVSRGTNKKEDAEKLGAKHYLATGDDVKKGVEGHEGSVDLIICTISEYSSVAEITLTDRPKTRITFPWRSILLSYGLSALWSSLGSP